MIQIIYDSIDGVHKEREYKTLIHAQAFAWTWVGHTPDVGEHSAYAVSFDGVGRVTWSGVDVKALFPSVFYGG
jgi:hypothetical protein